MKTRIVPADRDGIAEAAELIRDGQVVAVPTETVYGLAADATNGEAVARIYEAKGRPSFNPLIVHVPDNRAAIRIGEFKDTAWQLTLDFWPGPLTIVVPLQPGAGIAGLVTAGLPTIALRVPVNRTMRALLQTCKVPLAAPSANRSGRISPTRAEHALESLDGRIPLILDDGPTRIGLESTIVAVTDGKVRLLRPGPFNAEELGAVVEASDAIEAPGQLASHYAPAKPLRLDAVEAAPDEWLIGFGPIAGNVSLSPSGDLLEAAANLFDFLHQADRQALSRIAIAPIPQEDLGVAINDRLCRAAAPR